MNIPFVQKHPTAFVVIVAFVILSLQAWQSTQARSLGHKNRDLIVRVTKQKASIQQLERAQDESCTDYETLKGAVNDFHGQVRQLLRGAIRTNTARAEHIGNPKLRKVDLAQAAEAQRILDRTHLVTASCAQKSRRRPAR